ncbi:MAG: aminotransferase class IV [Bacteroidales bacterium]|nr:aminotransferase class IV [Bacteroidales bacterium]
MCLLLETIRVKDGKFCYPGYHQKRMDNSRNVHFPAGQPINIHDIPIPETAGTGIFKSRIIYDQVIREVEFRPYSEKVIRTIRLVKADHLEYPFKYLDRSGIEQLQKEHPGFDEVIFVKNGLITDSSFSNLAFLSGNKWFTPDQPLLDGTCRQRLIDVGELHPVQITYTDLVSYSHVSLINAMIDLKRVILPIEVIVW